MGMPSEITAVASFTDRGVDSGASIRLGFRDGKSATLEVMSIMDEIRKRIGLRYPSEIRDTDDPGIVS